MPTMTGNDRTTISYLFDPRFQGGTSAAIAAELRAICEMGLRPKLHAVESQMFSGRAISRQLEETMAVLGLRLEWNCPTIGGDLVVLHNPSFLKFDSSLASRIVAREVVVVTHENFLRPGGQEAFDIAHCLHLIDGQSLALRKTLAPISPHNRDGVARWLGQASLDGHWHILASDWFNICGHVLVEPTAHPRDRRGRLSRPGPEKFPALVDLDLCFPATSASNVILGADALIAADIQRSHWDLHEFNSLPVDHFFDMVDFMVYFTAPSWAESFGRVLAEAIAAGKVVVSDKGTAAMLPDAIVPAEPADVDRIIAHFVAHPDQYQAHVHKAQKMLMKFSPSAFRAMFAATLKNLPGART